ncbi:hypothetical protein, partial [Pseudoalteromonas luteoviolacea]|uniref:hypothetical protein n=1 Tax=Pseudoalteromonas luteoviolacea TaxID=43657 RepID=UPI000A5DDF4E
SYGAGDSTGARPDDFVPFPTNELNPVDFNRMHLGVLYLEHRPDIHSQFQEYYKVCVKAGKRMVIASNSRYDSMYKNINFAGKGSFKPTWKGGDDYGRLHLTLQHYYESKKERIVLEKIYESRFEFYGSTKRGKDYAGQVRGYYKGIDAYWNEGCDSHLGSY